MAIQPLSFKLRTEDADFEPSEPTMPKYRYRQRGNQIHRPDLSAVEPEEVRHRKFSSLSSDGLTYCWKDINVYAQRKTGIFHKKVEDVHILKDVTGYCKGGQLLAIMGASGAGKTTLLNVLTYRSQKLRIDGRMTINGRESEPDTLMGVSAYVQQEDLFTGIFTVKEQLHFHAQLRMGKGISESQRTKRIEEVLKELGLGKCADNLIGIPGQIKGISGGEKKRLAFACELITNPLMLICDEPTSGLDSFMAQSVMQAMKKMTDAGKTVISTIHQPNSEVFAMFDRLLLLAEGRVAFIGTVEEAMNFFNNIGHPCPVNFNPADHFIYTLGVTAGNEEKCRKFIHDTCDKFRDNEGITLDRKVSLEMRPTHSQEDIMCNIHIPTSPYRATWGNQFAAVTHRQMLNLLRNLYLVKVKIGQSLFFSIIFGLIYFDLDTTDASSNYNVQNVSGALFIFLTNLTFSTLFPAVMVFSGDMPLFLREHWNGLYRCDAYFIGRNLVELPLNILVPIMFSAITYYMVGFRTGGAEYFLWYLLIMILVGNVAISYAYMISCLAKDYNLAVVLSTPLTFPLFLFGGLYMNNSTIPVYLAWMKYLSWFLYSFEDLSINQWNDYNITTPVGVEIPLGNTVLDSLGFDPDHFGRNLYLMVALLIFYRVLAYIFLLLKARRKT